MRNKRKDIHVIIFRIKTEKDFSYWDMQLALSKGLGIDMDNVSCWEINKLKIRN